MTKAEEKAKEIQGLMERHSLALEEATQLWEEDNSDYCNEEMAEMENKAKALKRRYEKDLTKKRKPTERERKVDTEKLEILNLIVPTLQTISDNVERKNEVELHFTKGGNDYTIKLIKHRKKK